MFHEAPFKFFITLIIVFGKVNVFKSSFIFLVKKMTELKFTLDHFRQHDIPNPLINIYDYAYHITEKGCNICQTYQGWCILAAREKWTDQLIDFNFVIDNLTTQNRNWVDFGRFSTQIKDQIYMYILKERRIVFF